MLLTPDEIQTSFSHDFYFPIKQTLLNTTQSSIIDLAKTKFFIFSISYEESEFTHILNHNRGLISAFFGCRFPLSSDPVTIHLYYHEQFLDLSSTKQQFFINEVLNFLQK